MSIIPLIDTEDACFDLNASRPIAKGDLKWRDALLVAHRVNSNSFLFLCYIHNFTYLDISHIFIQNRKVRPKKENVYKYTLLTGKEVYKKMKILLAAVNAKYIHSNLAVYCLRAYAKEQHPASNITISEYTINQPFDEILMDIYKQAPDVLCLSCYLWNVTEVGQLIQEIPKILPDTKIWLGGPEVSYNAREVLEKYPMTEGIMRGEGEETFAELVAYYEGRGAAQLINIQGITFREEEKQIAETPSRQIMDLSKVPFVYGDIENFKNRIIYYETSRGCPFSCSYCLSSIDKCLRFRNLELVKKELQFFIDHEVPQVKFVDRTFNCKHDHAMAIWNYIKEHDKGITNFHFEVAADLLNEEEIELIRSLRPGLIQLEIGIQSTNKQTIKEINRSMNLEKVRDKVARIHEKGNVHQHLDLIAGLPYENYDSFAHSFNEVYAMEPDQFQLGFLKVLHGSVMHEKMKEYELLCQNRPPYEVLSTKWLPYSDVIRLKKVEEMVEVYYNSFQFSHTMRLLVELFPSAFSMYEKMGNYYEKKGLFGLNHSRLTRYEILWDFVESELAEFTCSEKMQKKEADFKEKVLESMTLDLYLRDNVKNRPAFLGESKVEKDVASEFYKKEAEEHKYLKDYEGYDSRQLRKMTHLERLNGKLHLFDYRHRNKLNQDAAIYIIED